MINIPKLSPFKHFCITVGNIPTTYEESLSYYEMLEWLCKYLKKEVIPVVNTNAEAVSELQYFVEHYFDTLDVQEEINNKLDQMAEDGSLADIIAEYIQLRGVLAYNTVSDMKSAENLVNGSFAETYGFYSLGDGGSAKYKIREITNQDTVDEHMIIALSDTNLVAEFIPELGKINLLKVGAKKDGTVDTGTLINNIIEKFPNYTIYIPAGDYLVNTTILLDTTTKIEGENQFKSRLFTNNAINIIENKHDDIATCYVSNLYLDGNNIGLRGLYLYRDRPNLVYNDSRTIISNLLIKKCTEWCMQIGDPNKNSNVIEIVVDNIYVHEYTGGGIYISKCSDSHFSNLRSGSGLHSSKPAILVEGYNLQILNSKGFLAGTEDSPKSGIVFNGGANIIAEVEAQANSKHGVEIVNTKDSKISIIADKNSLIGSDYAGVLIDKVQNCIIDAIISNNVATNQFNTITGCKVVEPKRLVLNLNCNSDITNYIDLSEYNTNQVFTVNSEININGYNKQDITPELSSSISAPSGVTITKVGKDSLRIVGTPTSDSNVWIIGAYGQHTDLAYLDTNHVYELNTNNSKVGMVLYNYVTNIGGGYNRKINGVDNTVTGVMIQLKGNTTYNDTVTPKIISILNK